MHFNLFQQVIQIRNLISCLLTQFGIPFSEVLLVKSEQDLIIIFYLLIEKKVPTSIILVKVKNITVLYTALRKILLFGVEVFSNNNNNLYLYSLLLKNKL